MAICKLCRLEKQLLKKSHIYPDFLYNDFYDEHHKLRKFSLQEMRKVNPRVSKPPTGIYESGILCSECDRQIFGSMETYISLLIRGKKDIRVTGRKINDDMTIFKLSGIDSNKIKLFLLSLLFRASISSKPEFIDVNLGPYEEKIRKALLNNNAQSVDMQISILKFAKNSNFTRFIAQPLRSKINHSTVYSFIINGYYILFFLKENYISRNLSNYRIQDSNEMEILQIPKKQVEKFILSIIQTKL